MPPTVRSAALAMYALVTIRRVEPLISLLFWGYLPYSYTSDQIGAHLCPWRISSKARYELHARGPGPGRGHRPLRRLTFVMVACHFVYNEELVGHLTQYQDYPTKFMKVFRNTRKKQVCADVRRGPPSTPRPSPPSLCSCLCPCSRRLAIRARDAGRGP